MTTEQVTYIVWKGGGKDGRYYTAEQWFTQRGRLFRLAVHTDPGYRSQSHRRLDLMSEAGWSCVYYSPLPEEFNTADLSEGQWGRLLNDAIEQAWIVASALSEKVTA